MHILNEATRNKKSFPNVLFERKRERKKERVILALCRHASPAVADVALVGVVIMLLLLLLCWHQTRGGKAAAAAGFGRKAKREKGEK